MPSFFWMFCPESGRWGEKDLVGGMRVFEELTLTLGWSSTFRMIMASRLICLSVGLTLGVSGVVALPPPLSFSESILKFVLIDMLGMYGQSLLIAKSCVSFDAGTGQV